MRRTILFRGHNGQNWVYGDLVQDKSGTCITNADLKHLVIVEPKSVGQFTGWHDKTKWDDLSKEEQEKWLSSNSLDDWKGRKIFEDDIVKATGRSEEQESIVRFVPHLGAWFLEDLYWIREAGQNSNNNGLDTFIEAEIKGNIAVIGNIHDNPELLEK